MKIYKYSIGAVFTNKSVKLALPIGALIIHVREQGDYVCLWCIVDPQETNTITRTFIICPTGVDIPNGGKYIGTAQTKGYFMWHVFEV